MKNFIWPEINKKTTIKQVIKIHKRIWTFTMIFGNKPNTPYICNCALCEWSLINNEKMCEECLADWGPAKCTDEGSPYYEWDHCSEHITAKPKEIKLAWKIRNIPLKSIYADKVSEDK